MPAALAPLVGFVLGVVFAWAAGAELSRTPVSLVATRALAIVVLFAFLVYGPFAGYFVTYATDWSLAYLVDGRRVPSALLLVIVLVDIASVPAGFAVGATRAREHRLFSLLPLATVPLAIAAVAVAVFSRRLAVFGTYAQITRSFGAVPLAGSAAGWAILWFFACLAFASAWTIRELRGGRTRRAG